MFFFLPQSSFDKFLFPFCQPEARFKQKFENHKIFVINFPSAITSTIDKVICHPRGNHGFPKKHVSQFGQKAIMNQIN